MPFEPQQASCAHFWVKPAYIPKRNFPGTQDAKGEMEKALTKFQWEVDVYRTQATSIAANAAGICLN